ENKPDIVQVLTGRIEKIDDEIAHHQKKIEELTVRAPIAGRLAATQDPQRMIGLRLKLGEELGTLIGDGRPTVALVMPEPDASIIRTDMQTLVRLWGDPREVYTWRV